MDEFVQQVRALKNLGASTAEISEHMSKVVEKRLDASNKPWGESIFNPLKEGEKAERDRRWRPLDDLRSGKDTGPGRPVSDGQLYAATAPLAWENRVGNCSESASVLSMRFLS